MADFQGEELIRLLLPDPAVGGTSRSSGCDVTAPE